MSERSRIRAARHAAEKKGVSSAIQRTTRQSPYKMRLVIDQIRGKDVNEALGLLRFSKKHAAKQIEKVLKSAVANAEQALAIAMNRYKGGLVSYLDVVFAQTALLANQRTATQIGGQRMVATVVLIKALGGGWLGVPAHPGTNPNPGSPGSTSYAANR